MAYFKNKGVFVVLIHVYKPQGNGQVEVYEECEFVDKLRNKHYTNSTAILDLVNKKILKNRTDNDSFDDFIKHVKESYPEQFTSLMVITGLTEEYYTVPELEEVEEVEIDLENTEDAKS